MSRASVRLAGLLLVLGGLLDHATAQIPRVDYARVLDLRQSVAGVRTDDRDEGSFLHRHVVARGLGLYRAVFSDQDASHCQFSPSCSHYAEQALQRQGLFVGFLMASDRLQRCHPFAVRSYPYDRETERLLDPFDDHGTPRGTGDTPPRKSPTRATLMSAVVPGLGQVYAGRTADGLSAFIGTAAPATFAALNFRRHGSSSVRGWMHASFAATFYLGNIWGAGEAARLSSRPTHAADSRSHQQSRITDPLWLSEYEAVDQLVAGAAGAEGDERRFEAALARFAAGDFDAATARFLDLTEGRAAPDLEQRARFFQVLSHLEAAQWNSASHALALLPEEKHDEVAISRVQSLLQGAADDPGLSPSLARIISAILPGSGQIYARHYTRGLISTAINALTISYVINCGRTESPGEMLITALPLFWRYYRGGIMSAGRSAEEFNHRRERETVDEAYRLLELDH